MDSESLDHQGSPSIPSLESVYFCCLQSKSLDQPDGKSCTLTHSVPPPGCFSQSQTYPTCAWGRTQLCPRSPSSAPDGLWLWGCRDPETGRGSVLGYRVHRGMWEVLTSPCRALTVAPSLRCGLSGGRGASLRSEAAAVHTQGPAEQCLTPRPPPTLHTQRGGT